VCGAKCANVYSLYEDVDQASALMTKLNNSMLKLIYYLQYKYKNDPIIQRLNKFDRIGVYEVPPGNVFNMNAFTFINGSFMGLCLRDSQNELLDYNTIMYVYIHEITHLGVNTTGHGPAFIKYFKLFLEEAVSLGIYHIENYAENNVDYGGMVLNTNILI
jgi:hypothetical protein